MSKIGRQAIVLGSVNVEVKGQDVHFKGAHANGVHTLPQELVAKIEDGNLIIALNPSDTRKITQKDKNRVWGLHRALLSNDIRGAEKPFEKKVIITGLGYKAVLSGKKLTFSLGYSHKVDFKLPDGVSVDVDKSGQNLIVKSPSKFLVGQVCSDMCALRPTEPYKGTGIRREDDIVIRKAGKAKSA